MQREDTPVMPTGLERIAAKAREEPKLRFTSLAHHVTKELIWKNLCRIPGNSAAGCDGKTVAEAKEEFEEWVEPTLSLHKDHRAFRLARRFGGRRGVEGTVF